MERTRIVKQKRFKCIYINNNKKYFSDGGRFGLFEAMSAIEMMDPKMDAGMIGNQVNRKVLNFEQAIKVHHCSHCAHVNTAH